MLVDARVFDDDHLPRDLKHREGAVETLVHAVEPTLQGRPADGVITTGNSGVGNPQNTPIDDLGRPVRRAHQADQ